MNQGIDSLIGNRLDAYGSSPQALMERYKLTGETVDLLALQAAANTVNEAKNNMLANAETNMPNERQALEQEVFQGTRNQLLSQLGPGIQQQGQQMGQQQGQQMGPQQGQQMGPQQGLPTQPSNIRMAAQGGIVGYAQGGLKKPGKKEKGIGAKNMDALLNALMVAESGGNPNAISSAGAEGAYQIMPSTAADPGFGVSPMEGSRFDPEASRGFARQYLQAMIDRYLGDIEVALIAYNAGAANADKFVAAGRDYSVLPQAAQTEPYVRKIMGQMQAQDNAESPNRNVNPRGRRDFSTNLNPPEARGLMARSQARAAENATDNAESPNRNVNPRGRRDFSTNLNPPEARGLMARSQQRAAADRGALPPVETSENVEGVESVEGALEYLQSIGRQQDQSAEGALDYLQNIGAQQEDRRARFDRAFPDVQPAVARAEQEKADGGIGYLRRLARKQEAKKQEGRRAARYLAMMQDSQNRINAADPAGRTEGQETPAADPDVLQYLAMLQENQNMVDAAGMPGEEEIEDVTTLIAGRGFNNGGGVRGFAGPDGSEVTLTEEEIDEAYRRRTGRDRPKSVFAPLQDFLGKLTTPPEYIINEAGFVVPNPSIRRTGEELAATMQEDADVLAEIEESVPGLSRAERVTLAGQELLDGRSTNKAEEPQFDPRSPQTGPFPEVPVVEEEDTSIKPDWNMLREWGAGGMGATNLADALGGSGRAVGAEIARQDKAALEERILTVKEAQMQIDKEIALAVSQQRMTSDVLDAIADLRGDPQIYYSRIGAEMGGITIDEVRERLQESDPAVIAAQMAVERQVMRTAGMGGLGATQQISDAELIAQATALNEGS